MSISVLNELSKISGLNTCFIVLAVVWSLVWKGFGLWRSAELRQRYWFIAMLVINTLGILEIIYLFVIARNYKVEVIEKNG